MVGADRDEMLALCDGLIENHHSDGVRCNTKSKRRDELVRMHRHTRGNVCSNFPTEPTLPFVRAALLRIIDADSKTDNRSGTVGKSRGALDEINRPAVQPTAGAHDIFLILRDAPAAGTDLPEIGIASAEFAAP